MGTKSNLFDPTRHNPDILSQTLSALPERLTLAGSLGRCVVMGELKTLRRKDGQPIDIDVIDTEGEYRLARQQTTGAFAVDAYLTNYMRPVDDTEWGVFIPELDPDTPYFTIPSELCAPQTINLPWAPESVVSAMPAALQHQLEHIAGRQYKNPGHRKTFMRWFAENGVPLPVDIEKKFNDFHVERVRVERQTLGAGERVYRKVRKLYIGFTPSLVQHAVESVAGSTIRKIRHTTLDQLDSIG